VVSHISFNLVLLVVMRAVVFGSTGAIGHEVVKEVLASDKWDAVIACVRKPTDKTAWTATPTDKLQVQV
jgi:uncharacterized protein YbjT (DUF2867 family)